MDNFENINDNGNDNDNNNETRQKRKRSPIITKPLRVNIEPGGPCWF